MCTGIGKRTGLKTGHYKRGKSGTGLLHSMKWSVDGRRARVYIGGDCRAPRKNPVKDEMEERR
jgi:hypothetical protein